MRLCLTCKYVSPEEAAFCLHCGRTFAGRRCSRGHLSPAEARLCIQCGSLQLSEPTRSFSLVPFVRLLAAGTVIGLGALALHVWPGPAHQAPAFASAAERTRGLVFGLVSVRLLDRVLALVLGGAVLLHLVPGAIGRDLRRAAGRALSRLGRGIARFLWRFLSLAALLTAATRLLRLLLLRGSGGGGPTRRRNGR